MLAGETAMTFDDILEQITTLLLEELGEDRVGNVDGDVRSRRSYRVS
jgi:hypothetical protein